MVGDRKLKLMKNPAASYRELQVKTEKDMSVKISIDGMTTDVAEGTTVLEAARKLNIDIPTLCHHPKLTPFGGCRLCIVDIKGIPRPVTSCTTPVSEGMEVTTSNPEI